MIKSVLRKPSSSSSLPITKTIRVDSVEVKEPEAAVPLITCTSSAETNNNNEVVQVKAVVTVKLTGGSLVSSLFGFTALLHMFADLLGKTFLLELVSTELDLITGLEKKTIQGYAHVLRKIHDEVTFESSFSVPAGFGEVGAVLFENRHHEELYIKTIHLHINGFLDPSFVTLPCDSWVHSKFVNPDKTIFFTTKSYLPSEPPSGSKRLRELKLQYLRENGEGERKASDIIFDYDTYNDLGDPDSNDGLTRPVLGGKERPYLRRCRTGRPCTKKDPLSEERSSDVYVPRDEAFSEVKEVAFTANNLKSVLHTLLPQLESLNDPNLGFPYFTMFNEGVTMPKLKSTKHVQSTIPRLVKAVKDSPENCLRFEIPELMDRDKFSWFRDEEFSRQALAGLNPFSIELVKEWPEIRGRMTFNKAMERNKIFMLDYHDLLMPYVNKVREIEGTTLYGSRTLFFLTVEGTLRPVAIELTRPPVGDKPQWKQVFTPSWDDCMLAVETR